MSARSRRILFLHANGFPSGVYSQFLTHLRARAEVVDLPIIETPESMAPRRRWRAMFESLRPLIAAPQNRGCSLVGHSMGGYLSLMLAADALPRHHPVVLIDSPMVLGWRGALFGMAKRTGLSYRFGPAPIAHRRRDRWRDREAARAFFAGKGFVQRWAPGVLDDFLEHGLSNTAGGAVTLRIPKTTERDIYAHVAEHEALRALRRLRAAGEMPGFVAGQRSEELRLAGRDANRRLFGPHWQELPAGHLVPMEVPLACANAVFSLLEASWQRARSS